jgi:hypothetical protein
MYALDEGMVHLECLTKEEAIREIRQQAKEAAAKAQAHPWADDPDEDDARRCYPQVWLLALIMGFSVAGFTLGVIGLVLR